MKHGSNDDLAVVYKLHGFKRQLKFTSVADMILEASLDSFKSHVCIKRAWTKRSKK
ncbi:hypothetical protein Dimus_029511, partial [Dionaea muscipula]